MYASQNGHSEIADLLLKQQADPNVQNNDGFTALMLASQNGHPEVADKWVDCSYVCKPKWTF
jgi:serine/threonine-protein phosphatase 6 regulatory ankyrin repeat subunit B